MLEHGHGEERFGAAPQAAEWDARYNEPDGALWSGCALADCCSPSTTISTTSTVST